MIEVIVKTKCGEIHHIHVDQEVESVEVGGKAYSATPIKETPPKRFTQVRQKGIGGWMINMKAGFALTGQGNLYYSIVNPDGETVGNIRSKDIEGEPYLA